MDFFFEQMGPGRLALYSLIIGPTPLLFSVLAIGICKLTGGTVDASQAQGCFVLGMNLNNLVHSLFMSYMLVFITIGLMGLGLLYSGVWAVIRLF